MSLGRQKYLAVIVVAGAYFFSQSAFAVLFEPGVGVGAEYTDNASLASENPPEDLITLAYVGVRMSEDEGALTYDATASFNNQNYTKDTFVNQRNFNLNGNADWAMVKERVNWFLSNYYSQRTINTSNSNTPNNLQDTNAFTFGANIRPLVTARQSISLLPLFVQYYYEELPTDNKQYSLAANWAYNMSRLTSVGLNFSAKRIDYTENDLLGRPIVGTTFTNMAIIFNGQRLRSVFAINLGATKVKRDNNQETTGFTGYFNWLVNLSSRSMFESRFSTDVTDTSSAAFSRTDGTPGSGGANDVQIVADVLRDSNILFAYIRKDVFLNTRIWVQYNDQNYSNDLLDRTIRTYGIEASRPITQLLSSGVYANYNRTRNLNPTRLDESYTVGGNLRYHFSRKLNGLLDLKYRTKDSTVTGQSFEEFSVFATLTYGFGNVRRPSSTGGF